MKTVPQPLVTVAQKRFALCYRTVVCLPACPACDVGVLWPDGWIKIVKMPLGMEVGVNTGLIVLDGDLAPPKGNSPQFSAHVCCGRTAGWIKMPLGIEVGLGPGDIVLDQDATWYGGRPRPRPHCVRCGPSSPFSLERAITAPPHFLTHVCCGQTARWIRIPTMEVSLGPGNVVLHGDPAPRPRKGTQQPPRFGPLCSGTVAHLSCCFFHRQTSQ